MDLKFLGKGMLIGLMIGTVLVPRQNVIAEEGDKTERTVTAVENNKGYLAFAAEEIAAYVETSLHTLYKDMAFGENEEGSFTYVRTGASEDCDWVGKLYDGNVAKVVSMEGEWAQIESGSVTGYVMTKDLMTGETAEAQAKDVIVEKRPDVNVEAVTEEKAKEVVQECFSFAESKEEEEARKAAARQAVVDFAVQFSGNPYRWGGTSLTNGADCSGFVMSVYANFGYGMPHSSSAMRNCGVEVSYSDVQPGDVICYDGHVGIYAGNGQIINAIDDAHGIGLSSATYANIITVRRMIQ